MAVSLILLVAIIKLFLILLMGFCLIKTRKLTPAAGHVLSVLLVYIILPCVIIHSFQLHASPAVEKGLFFAFIAAVGVHIIFILFTAVLRKPLQLQVVEQASLIYTNAGILVFPLVTEILGPQYVIYPCTYMAVQLLLLWTHGSYLMSGSGAINIRGIITNINIIAIVIGAILFLMKIHIPAVIDDTMNMVGSTIGPVGMLITGIAIAEKNIKTVFLNLRNYKQALWRLLVYPAVLIVIFAAAHATSYVPDGKHILMTVFIASITPAAAVVTSLAEFYRQDAPYAAELCVVSTVLALVTMPCMLFIFDTVV
ncbi:AEC family transporter [Megasphaera lornae]|jgi:hypothetical protein|uniref:Transporter, auxin efflux carrier (AEC) family protein n=1 Tax=Megasphaera lornae TaxID=1000568 RepID=D3LSV7_9FIRM|nr:AEC family transporter [Megasphaera genomosp. type_1]EFD94741.1 transporter, auxin efflux carrier (AEC) family protein [Megasphaera genomosp. type_1 str. 28L]